MCAAMDPAVSLSTHSLLPMVSFVDHTDHAALSASKVVDNGEAPDWDDPEMGKTRQWSRRRRGVGNLTGLGAGWAYTRHRITGGAEWRDGLAVGGVAFR